MYEFTNIFTSKFRSFEVKQYNALGSMDLCVCVRVFETMKKISLINLLRISLYYYFKWTLTTTTYTYTRVYIRERYYIIVSESTVVVIIIIIYVCVWCVELCTRTESRKFSMKTKMAFHLLPFWSPNFIYYLIWVD